MGCGVSSARVVVDASALPPAVADEAVKSAQIESPSLVEASPFALDSVDGDSTSQSTTATPSALDAEPPLVDESASAGECADPASTPDAAQTSAAATPRSEASTAIANPTENTAAAHSGELPEMTLPVKLAPPLLAPIVGTTASTVEPLVPEGRQALPALRPLALNPLTASRPATLAPLAASAAAAADPSSAEAAHCAPPTATPSSSPPLPAPSDASACAAPAAARDASASESPQGAAGAARTTPPRGGGASKPKPSPRGADAAKLRGSSESKSSKPSPRAAESATLATRGVPEGKRSARDAEASKGAQPAKLEASEAQSPSIAPAVTSVDEDPDNGPEKRTTASTRTALTLTPTSSDETSTPEKNHHGSNASTPPSPFVPSPAGLMSSPEELMAADGSARKKKKKVSKKTNRSPKELPPLAGLRNVNSSTSPDHKALPPIHSLLSEAPPLRVSSKTMASPLPSTAAAAAGTTPARGKPPAKRSAVTEYNVRVVQSPTFRSLANVLEGGTTTGLPTTEFRDGVLLVLDKDGRIEDYYRPVCTGVKLESEHHINIKTWIDMIDRVLFEGGKTHVEFQAARTMGHTHYVLRHFKEFGIEMSAVQTAEMINLFNAINSSTQTSLARFETSKHLYVNTRLFTLLKNRLNKGLLTPQQYSRRRWALTRALGPLQESVFDVWQGTSDVSIHLRSFLNPELDG